MKQHFYYYKLLVIVILLSVLFSSLHAETLTALIPESYKTLFQPKSLPVSTQFKPQKQPCNVTYEFYDNTEELIKRLQATPGLYDIIFTYQANFKTLADKQLIQSLDQQQLTIKQKPTSFIIPIQQQQLNFVVPYLFHTLGLIYRNDIIKYKISSWSDYFTPAEVLKKRIAFYQDPQFLFSTALLLLGDKPGSRDYFKTKQAARLLYKLKAENYVGLHYENSATLLKELNNGSIALGVIASGDAAKALKQPNSHLLTYILPKEGSCLYIDGLCIAKGSTKKALAYQLLNHLTEPTVQAAKAFYLEYGCPDKESYSLLKKIAPIQSADSIAYPTAGQLKKLYHYPPLPQAAVTYWKTIFQPTTDP